MECNKEQKEAIMHRDGPAMVLAGPGAGKTYVITNRVKALIDEYGVKPEQILVVTFSKAAAVEMKERFEMLTGGRRLPVRFGTFHSVFFQILRLAYHYEVKDIATPALKYRFLEETLNETGYGVDDKKEFLSDIEKEISRVKGEGIEIDCYFSSACSAEIFQKMYRGYQEKLQRHRCLDFDDMVVYTYQLLKEREDIRRRWQAQFRYLLIDEFQDINRLQYETVCMLAEPENNLFIVGDDDQSIYGFRGAKPGIMLSFPKRFPDTKQIVLGVNYRCSDEIMKAAERLIGKNNERYEKHIVANKGKEQPVHMKKCENLPDEAEKIVAQLHTQLRGFEELNQFGLYENGTKVTDKPEILFARMDINEVMEKVEAMRAAEAPKEEKKEEPEEAVIDIEAKPEITYDDFAKLQFQVGEIIACEAVKKSKKLLCSQVKIGSQVKQIVSGIKAHYTPEEMVGKKVMVVVNLKPAKLAGILSEGMLLCAEDADGNLSLMTPEKPMPSGAEIC